LTDTLWANSTDIQNNLINSTLAADVTYLTNVGIPFANREVDNFVFNFLDGIPLSTGLTNDLIAAANFIAAEQWWITQKDYKQAEHLRTQATSIFESAKMRAAATPTLRRTMQGRNKGYYSDPLASEGLQTDMKDAYY